LITATYINRGFKRFAAIGALNLNALNLVHFEDRRFRKVTKPGQVDRCAHETTGEPVKPESIVWANGWVVVNRELGCSSSLLIRRPRKAMSSRRQVPIQRHGDLGVAISNADGY
jgi:hypothetical protein